jgi:metal-responsive CopG/Arc/MetJ family transcriptional regulator
MEAKCLKHYIGLTIDTKLLKKIENIRGREKRSPFIEHLIRLGLKTYRTENQSVTIENRKVPYFSNSIPHSVSDRRKF